MVAPWSLGIPGKMDTLLFSAGVLEYECHERVGIARFPSVDTFVEVHLRCAGEYHNLVTADLDRMQHSAEQVRAPTMTRLISAMETQGLVRRKIDADDRRIQQVHATAKGRRVLEAGRRRRIETLAAQLEELPAREIDLLARAAERIDSIATSSREP